MASGFWSALTRFDRSKIHPPIAVRNSCGVLIPLAIGVAIGQPAAGLIASIGALNVAYSDGIDPYPTRARRMMASSLCCALALFAGCATGHSHPLTIVLTALAAFLAGMMVAVSTTAADIGNIALVTLIVFSAHPLALAPAAQSGLLGLAGGLLQALLALALWPVHPYAPERRSLSQLYAALSNAATEPPRSSEAPPASAEIISAQTVLADLRSSPSMEADRLLAMLSQAERIRLSIVTLRRLRTRLARDFGAEDQAAAITEALAATARDLDAIGQGASPPPPQFAKVADTDAQAQLDALAGQLRATADMAGHGTEHGAREMAALEQARPWRLRAESVRAALVSNLALSSAAFRHALRLAACAVAGEIAAFWLGWVRSYWIPMTAVIVLRPDFTATFTRGILRVAGTLLGLGFATVLFHLLTPPHSIQVALIFAMVLLLRWYGSANYGVFVIALSALIVLLLAVTGAPPMQVIAARARGTLLGGAIALIGYGLWPTWERGLAGNTLAVMFDAYRDYFAAIARAYIEAGAAVTSELDGARQGARLARSNAEASAARLRTEPGVPAERLRAVDSLLANSHRLARALMSLESGIARSSPAPARPAFRKFAGDVEQTLGRLASVLRGNQFDGSQLPDLRRDHNELMASGDAAVERYALVNVEADRIVNALNTLAKLAPETR